MSGDGPALLGMPDILKVTFEVLECQQERKEILNLRQYNGQITLAAKQTKWKIKSDSEYMDDDNSNMQDYFSSNMNRAADKNVSQILTEK